MAVFIRRGSDNLSLSEVNALYNRHLRYCKAENHLWYGDKLCGADWAKKISKRYFVRCKRCNKFVSRFYQVAIRVVPRKYVEVFFCDDCVIVPKRGHMIIRDKRNCKRIKRYIEEC